MLPPPGQPLDSTPPALQPPRPPQSQSLKRRMPHAPGIGLSPIQRRVTLVEEAAFSTLEADAGSRHDLALLLQHANLGKDVDYVVGLLADPDNDRFSLAQVAALGKISLAKLFAMVKAALMARANFKSHTHIAQGLPEVVKGVMTDAIPGQRPCAICGGLGQIPGTPTPDGPPEPRDCPTCKGSGIVVYEPAIEVRKVALQMGKLLDSGRTNSLTMVNANLSQVNGGADYDKLMSRLDQVLYGDGRARTSRPGPVMDGEVEE